mmetsp:Transcript_24399/g.27714  ORF Transcript_24399/g.27714 Transcript_24399/m.27714 type:complete len:116 (-) Transcript_24399:481-828(-)
MGGQEWKDHHTLHSHSSLSTTYCITIWNVVRSSSFPDDATAWDLFPRQRTDWLTEKTIKKLSGISRLWSVFWRLLSYIIATVSNNNNNNTHQITWLKTVKFTIETFGILFDHFFI